MSLLSPSVRLLGVVLISATAVAACSSSNSTGPSTTDLAGNYTLASFEEVGVTPTLAPPLVTGNLVLTTTRYKATININIPGSEQAIVDSGTYTVSGSNITQTSDVQPVQLVGTFTLTGSSLVTDLTGAGNHVKSTWTKQ